MATPKLNLADLTVSSFETSSLYGYTERQVATDTDEPTPATRCFDCPPDTFADTCRC